MSASQFDTDTPALPRAQVLLAATLKLMTACQDKECAHLCRMVAHNLALIARHPDTELDPLVRQVCARLACDWRQRMPQSLTGAGETRH